MRHDETASSLRIEFMGRRAGSLATNLIAPPRSKPGGQSARILATRSGARANGGGKLIGSAPVGEESEFDRRRYNGAPATNAQSPSFVAALR